MVLLDREGVTTTRSGREVTRGGVRLVHAHARLRVNACACPPRAGPIQAGAALPPRATRLCGGAGATAREGASQGGVPYGTTRPRPRPAPVKPPRWGPARGWETGGRVVAPS